MARWETVKGASGYRLDVSTSPSFDSYVSSYRDLDVGNVPNFVVTGLKRGTTYYYRVRPYSSAGTGSSSEALSVMTAGSGAGHASRSNESRKGELVRLVISQAGDMAEEFGNFTLGFDQPDKTHISFDGSYLRVWRKIRGEWLEDAYFARPNEPAEKTEQKSGS